MIQSPLLQLDNADMEIIEYLQEESELTHSEIATRMGYSQPTIGLRVKKLMSTGILEKVYGLNVGHLGLTTAVVQFTAKYPAKIFKLAENCPNIVNCMQISGERNIIVEVIGKNLSNIGNLIDKLFRSDDDIYNVKVEFLSRSMNDIVTKLDVFNLQY